MDLSELRERVERSRPSEGTEQSGGTVDLGPRCVLDADDLAHMKQRARDEGYGEGYSEGFGRGREWSRDETLRKVRDAETRGVLVGLLAAREAVEATPTIDGAMSAMGTSLLDEIGEMYQAVSREGLHGEREQTTANFIDFGQGKMWPMTDPQS